MQKSLAGKFAMLWVRFFGNGSCSLRVGLSVMELVYHMNVLKMLKLEQCHPMGQALVRNMDVQIDG